MENKQPEDDLFDRLNVSGQSAQGCRGARPEPPKLLKGEVFLRVPGALPQPVLGHPVYPLSQAHSKSMVEDPVGVGGGA